ncbi:MAG: helix-turn-helix domain-containing protein [Candidatus Thorarchaeota archaeon]
MKTEEKKRAIELRKKGWSYNEIKKEVNVSKGTLSLWLRDMKLTKSQIERFSKKQKLATIKNAEKHKQFFKDRRDKVKSEYDPPMNDPKFMMGLGLYWGEGTKAIASVGMSNSEPEIIIWFINWINDFFPGYNFSIRVHHYDPSKDSEIKKWWSNKLNIPIKFTKSNFSVSGASSKKRPKLKFGTAHLIVTGRGVWKVRQRIEKALECAKKMAIL